MFLFRDPFFKKHMVGNVFKNSVNTHPYTNDRACFCFDIPKNTNVGTPEKTRFKHTHALNNNT